MLECNFLSVEAKRTLGEKNRFMSAWPVDPHVYGSFLLIMAGMAASPGPANMFALATGLAKGAGAGLRGVAGMNIASLVWFIAAALGLGVLLKQFPSAFHALAIVGGLYLGWLGAKSVWKAIGPSNPAFALTGTSAGESPFREGFFVQITNPKALIFFAAVLPPFIDQARPIVPQLAMFAVGMIGFDAIQMSLYALAGGFMAKQFSQPQFARLFSGTIGLILIGTAVMVLYKAVT